MHPLSTISLFVAIAAAWLLSFHPNAGRVYAAYGGMYVASAVLWAGGWWAAARSLRRHGSCDRPGRHGHDRVQPPLAMDCVDGGQQPRSLHTHSEHSWRDVVPQ